MKSIRNLLFAALVYLSFNGLAFSNSTNYVPETSSGFNPFSSSSCDCTCDECRNCSNKHSSSDPWGSNSGYNVMSSRDFADFKKLINDRTFESTKMDMTRDVIVTNAFTTDQVREILSWFTFESNKLELAKLAFASTYDWNNYYKLYDIFVFESNVTDLDNFIKNKK
ncbi:MAG: DUF4476 domain-containing protein [Ignavibacteria bacterium]|nr:DUF4476 domain-containing protein [Ignavibacteria bacterium]